MIAFCLFFFSISLKQVLGSGFEVISVGKKKLIRSVPTELNKDHNEILELAQVWPVLFFQASVRGILHLMLSLCFIQM